MRKGTGDAPADDAESAIAKAASGPATSLPDDLRSRFETSLGTDLSGVRVHTGAESEAAAAAVGAKAYAIGNDIHFAAGAYDPSSSSGQELIAHEVAHTVQQRSGSPQRQHKLVVSQASDSFEHEADAAASAMVAGRPAQISSSGILLARKEAPKQPEKTPLEKQQDQDKDLQSRTPTWKDTSASVPIWPEMGTSLSFDWGENPELSLGMEGELEHKLAEHKHNQDVQLGPGIVAGLSGSVSASLFAKASGSAAGKWSEDAEGKKQLTKTLQGGGEAGVKATGSLTLSAGVGVANLLSVQGGVKGSLSATGSGSVTLAGTILKKFDGTEQGSTTFTVQAQALLSASADLTADLVVPGDRKNIYTYSLGKLDLVKATAKRVTTSANGSISNTPVQCTFEICPELKLQQRTQRPMTELEKKRYAPEVENGASGGRAESAGDGVDLTNEELFDLGKAEAMAKLTAMRGKAGPVQDAGSAGLAISMLVDGVSVPGAMRDDPQARALELEQGKKLRRVTEGALLNFDLGSPSAEIVKTCAKNPTAVSMAILSRHARITIVGTQFEYDSVPPSICKKPD